jgi:hypothetical protein
MIAAMITATIIEELNGPIIRERVCPRRTITIIIVTIPSMVTITVPNVFLLIVETIKIPINTGE